MCVYDKIMDDFVIANLHESRNEWCGRLVSLFTPLITEGIQSIFDESWRMCVENDEVGKYLMTFQNLISRIPTWNSVIIEEERKRIIERSGCNYLEDLITCVHIIQLKVLTCIRVGNKQKKIDISIPKLDIFIHKIYVNVARKVYSNVYLCECSAKIIHECVFVRKESHCIATAKKYARIGIAYPRVHLGYDSRKCSHGGYYSGLHGRKRGT